MVSGVPLNDLDTGWAIPVTPLNKIQRALGAIWSGALYAMLVFIHTISTIIPCSSCMITALLSKLQEAALSIKFIYCCPTPNMELVLKQVPSSHVIRWIPHCGHYELSRKSISQQHQSSQKANKSEHLPQSNSKCSLAQGFQLKLAYLGKTCLQI